MERLIEQAARAGFQAEIYSLASTRHAVSYQDGAVHEIDSSLMAGVSLRILRDGKQGFAYTKNLTDRGELLRNAIASLQGGVEAEYELPSTPALPERAAFDASIEELSSTRMAEECVRVNGILASRTESEIWVDAGSDASRLRILNTAGTDLSARFGTYGIRARCLVPGSGAGIGRRFEGQVFAPMPDAMLDEIVDLYLSASVVVEPAGGHVSVMFLPDSMIALVWRIQSGLSAKSVHDGVSPVADKQGERIWSENLTIHDDPTDARFPGARAFDDEGVPCARFPLVERGVLRNFYCDLNYATKLGLKPTGHGYRTTMWGGDPTTLRPAPALTRMSIEPGAQSFDELVRGMDRGLLLQGILGAHSGNIPHGDYSVGVCPGLWVEDGRIVGRVKDAMVAGNVYTTLRNVIGVGDRLHPAFGGHFPALLCDDVSVAT